jgi:serine/threonine protein kinase
MHKDSFRTKYKYIRHLGHGGCGDVFLAENTSLGNLWAVKEIPKGRETTVSGYLEPEILKRLNHPALPRICDVYEDDHNIYIVEDYLDGICLKQELEEKGRIEEQKAVDFAIQLCSVLDYLHGQRPDAIVYGDMKPHNIILTNGNFVKLIDFGISALVQTSGSKKYDLNETAFIGTKGYAAPEQFSGGGISPATDIYSLGITIIQLITGLDPIIDNFAFHPYKLSQYLSTGLYEILIKCINPEPQMRYTNAEELMNALKQYGMGGFGSAENKKSRLRPFARIIAVTGTGGTGVSTLTAALAQRAAGRQSPTCTVDLSSSGVLGQSLAPSNTLSSTNPVRVRSNLFYLRFNIDTKEGPCDSVELYKLLTRIQEDFTYIFIDSPLRYISCIERYLDHVFIVSDMNPFGLSGLGTALEQEGLTGKIKSKVSFIINKFYKGELGTDIFIQSVLLKNSISMDLRELVIHSGLFEVPYDEKVYLKWMYSYFGDSVKFGNLVSDQFSKAISNIIFRKVILRERRKSLFK